MQGSKVSYHNSTYNDPIGEGSFISDGIAVSTAIYL